MASFIYIPTVARDILYNYHLKRFCCYIRGEEFLIVDRTIFIKSKMFLFPISIQIFKILTFFNQFIILLILYVQCLVYIIKIEEELRGSVTLSLNITYLVISLFLYLHCHSQKLLLILKKAYINNYLLLYLLKGLVVIWSAM